MTDGALLVVDDAKPNRDLLARRLLREGYQVLTAESGRQAIEMIRQENVSLVLLDLMMPEMNGIEVLEELRKTYGDLELPVLMVSANTDSPQMVAAIDLGANDYLTKPIDFAVLLAKVRRHLNIRGGSSGTTASRPVGPAPITPKPTPPKLPPPKPGEMLGHYELGAMLGQGGMGQVYLAHDTRLLRDVALKVLVGDSLPASALDRFVIEARAVARVSHPGVITIHEIATEPRYFIAMELLKGKPLHEVSQKQPMDPGRALPLMMQVLEALQVVHEAGIIHRDLKPGNIMVLPNDRVKVLDFGLAKMEGLDLKLTKTGQVWGTPQYMAPEQLDSEFGELDNQTDLFAAACILYELLTAACPFNGRSLSTLIFEIIYKDPPPLHKHVPGLSPALSDAVLRGLQKRKDMRYPNCQAFLEELKALKLA